MTASERIREARSNETCNYPPRCPGCGVFAVSHNAEHLDNCPYQGRNALPLKAARV